MQTGQASNFFQQEVQFQGQDLASPATSRGYWCNSFARGEYSVLAFLHTVSQQAMCYMRNYGLSIDVTPGIRTAEWSQLLFGLLAENCN